MCSIFIIGKVEDENKCYDNEIIEEKNKKIE
jgi:hypothetical protein